MDDFESQIWSYIDWTISSEQLEKWIYDHAEKLEKKLGSNDSLKLFSADFRNSSYTDEVNGISRDLDDLLAEFLEPLRKGPMFIRDRFEIIDFSTEFLCGESDPLSLARSLTHLCGRCDKYENILSYELTAYTCGCEFCLPPIRDGVLAKATAQDLLKRFRRSSEPPPIDESLA